MAATTLLVSDHPSQYRGLLRHPDSGLSGRCGRNALPFPVWVAPNKRKVGPLGFSRLVCLAGEVIQLATKAVQICTGQYVIPNRTGRAVFNPT